MQPEGKLANYGALRKALELSDLAVADLRPLSGQPALARLVSQQLASADSIASNIEEGYGRGSPRDYAHFPIIGRGSAQETAGRYRRLKHGLPPETIESRVALCQEIIAILTRSIATLRARK